MFFSQKSKCNMKPTSKTACSASSQITGGWGWGWGGRAVGVYSQFMSFKIVKANITIFEIIGQKQKKASPLLLRLTHVFVGKVLTFSLRFKPYLHISFYFIFSTSLASTLATILSYYLQQMTILVLSTIELFSFRHYLVKFLHHSLIPR